MKKMSQAQLRTKLINSPMNYQWAYLNNVRLAENESYIHERAKFELSYLLCKAGQWFGTEYPYTGSRTQRGKKAEADVFWVDEMRVIEFENKYSAEMVRKKMQNFPHPVDVWVVDLKSWTPENAIEKTRELAVRLGVTE